MSDVGFGVAAANSAPTFGGIPSVERPCAAASIARNCFLDFAGTLWPMAEVLGKDGAFPDGGIRGMPRRVQFLPWDRLALRDAEIAVEFAFVGCFDFHGM